MFCRFNYYIGYINYIIIEKVIINATYHFLHKLMVGMKKVYKVYMVKVNYMKKMLIDHHILNLLDIIVFIIVVINQNISNIINKLQLLIILESFLGFHYCFIYYHFYLIDHFNFVNILLVIIFILILFIFNINNNVNMHKRHFLLHLGHHFLLQLININYFNFDIAYFNFKINSIIIYSIMVSFIILVLHNICLIKYIFNQEVIFIQIMMD